MSLRTAIVVGALGFSAVAPAAAQTKAPPTTAQGSDTLSSKLSKSDGVIRPKGDVDPDIKVPAPAPHPNSTPVIPPAATGGNNAK